MTFRLWRCLEKKQAEIESKNDHSVGKLYGSLGYCSWWTNQAAHALFGQVEKSFIYLRFYLHFSYTGYTLQSTFKGEVNLFCQYKSSDGALFNGVGSTMYSLPVF